ncbi:MAG: GDSL-type esterase/lipase family protein [Dongiaceae bacterium]
MTTLRICFVGDSITAGTGDHAYLGWPGRRAARERAAGHDVTAYNLGVRADTSELVAARWRAECRARLPDHVAGAIVFAFGVNDAAIEAGQGLRVPLERSVETADAILAAAKAWQPVLWIGPAPVPKDGVELSPAPGVAYAFANTRIAAVNDAYRAAAAGIGVPYLDLFAALAATPDWAAALARGDGVHPAAEGYALVAGTVGAWGAWRAWFDGSAATSA